MDQLNRRACPVDMRVENKWPQKAGATDRAIIDQSPVLEGLIEMVL